SIERFKMARSDRQDFCDSVRGPSVARSGHLLRSHRRCGERLPHVERLPEQAYPARQLSGRLIRPSDARGTRPARSRRDRAGPGGLTLVRIFYGARAADRLRLALSVFVETFIEGHQKESFVQPPEFVCLYGISQESGVVGR